MSVREWPWWRLYVKVAPLLNVHRTEDQLKARTVRKMQKEKRSPTSRVVYPLSLLSDALRLCAPIGRARASQGESGAFGAGT